MALHAPTMTTAIPTRLATAMVPSHEKVRGPSTRGALSNTSATSFAASELASSSEPPHWTQNSQARLFRVPQVGHRTASSRPTMTCSTLHPKAPGVNPRGARNLTERPRPPPCPPPAQEGRAEGRSPGPSRGMVRLLADRRGVAEQGHPDAGATRGPGRSETARMQLAGARRLAAAETFVERQAELPSLRRRVRDEP